MKILFLFFIFFVVSCSGNLKVNQNCNNFNKKDNTQEKVQEIEMNEFLIRKNDSIEIDDLLKKADNYILILEYDNAIKIYKVLEDVLEGEDNLIIKYNIAIVYKKQKEYIKALNNFEIIVNNSKNESLITDSLINITQIYGLKKNWSAINESFDKYFNKLNSNKVWGYIELAIRYQIALFNEKRYDDSEFLFLKIKMILKDINNFIDISDNKKRYFLSMSYFFAGELVSLNLNNIKLIKNDKKLAKILDEKSNMILKAQNYYFKSIYFKDKYWVIASAYKIGKLYDDLYNELTSMKLPDSLSFEEEIVYKEELKIRIQNLLKKAIDIFENNIELSEKLSQNNIWVKKTIESLKRSREKFIEIKKMELKN